MNNPVAIQIVKKKCLSFESKLSFDEE